MGLGQLAATGAIVAWAKEQPEFATQVRALNAFMMGGTTYLTDDEVLYAFCEFRKCRAPPGTFDGTNDGGDFLHDFAVAAHKRQGKLAPYEGHYEIVRVGSAEIRTGAKPNFEIAQSFELEITCIGKHGPHARFRYLDKEGANPDKPKANKAMWQGRVVATHDALYLIGVSANKADAAMFILWNHPDDPEILVGAQFAKMAPGHKDPDRRDYSIGRRIGAIRMSRGANMKRLRQKAQDWVSLDSMGAVFPIDRADPPPNNRD